MAASAQRNNMPAVRRNDVVVHAVAAAAVADDGGQSFWADGAHRWTTASVVLVSGAFLVDKAIWSLRRRSGHDADGSTRRQRTPTLIGRSRAGRAGEDLDDRDSSVKTVTRRRRG